MLKILNKGISIRKRTLLVLSTLPFLLFVLNPNIGRAATVKADYLSAETVNPAEGATQYVTESPYYNGGICSIQLTKSGWGSVVVTYTLSTWDAGGKLPRGSCDFTFTWGQSEVGTKSDFNRSITVGPITWNSSDIGNRYWNTLIAWGISQGSADMQGPLYKMDSNLFSVEYAP